MITFARDQHVSLAACIEICATGRQPVTRNLAAIIESIRLHHLCTRGRNQRGQVEDLTILPKESVLDAEIAGERTSHDLTMGIDYQSFAVAIARKDPQVGDDAIPPDGCGERIVGEGGCPNNFTGVIDAISHDKASTNSGSEHVNQLSTIP